MVLTIISKGKLETTFDKQKGSSFPLFLVIPLQTRTFPVIPDWLRRRRKPVRILAEQVSKIVEDIYVEAFLKSLL